MKSLTDISILNSFALIAREKLKKSVSVENHLACLNTLCFLDV